ncbi:Holliday junction resolvase RecU [Sporolactobacillus shoreicorticis]|uniref:Holliday junction resolvase RecU n=1 Tax=Sporolactobacillus shoreicorticis TaxID=1923877 RepID=A0ABW5S756_9BACL|nr:Holliday junction resolvase RecU [Sporolactobacillus shoreicorticis]MCO7125766.1 Holliday junction resolvase RecU [Sporolactobacillus shoreicorticis]
MTVFYPNGQPYQGGDRSFDEKTDSEVAYGHRGMTLEEDLNVTNRYYIETDQAVIYKKPTPIQIVHVDYPKRSAAKITEAYFRRASTTDYNGIYKGKYIDFEAKETTHAHYIPLKNFHAHQVEHMKRIKRHGGIGFIIVKFTQSSETFLLDADFLAVYWDASLTGGRKSIPKQLFQEHGHLIPQNYLPRIDYLRVVKEVYF